tara:strand:- start:2690 stop:3364 length:675 start_codon:yes stop_codon:yes gene_type:complete
MITLSQLVQELQEGVYDPNIFKAIFLAGGPGSGKSYVVRRALGGEGMKVINSDDAFERLLKKAGLSLRMPEREKDQRDIVRGRAKELTTTRQTNYIEGRLGVIIDGTGRDYDRITKQASELQGLGYDTYMIFVNTSLEVALQRNEKRARRVEDSIVKRSWNAVQQNIGKFSLFFRQGFVVVDNNRADEDVMRTVSKRIKSLLRKPVQNGRAKAWIQKELQKKKR